MAGRISSRKQRRRDHAAASFGKPIEQVGLAHFLTPPDIDRLRPHAWWVKAASSEILAHRFDLLGSGPTSLRHGVEARGVEGHVYGAPAYSGANAYNAANRAEVDRISAMIGSGYEPIDWHRDFKSGYRWPESAWYLDIAYGHEPGVDIKVPWELARLQHLPLLVWAHMLAGAEPGFEEAARYEGEIRNQLLDFIAHNPPRFGVNWRCTMDVAIRAANMAVGCDLARTAGVEFDAAVLAEVQRSLREHARHIRANLEWDPEFRANHYLANIAGLLIAAAYLPADTETDAWIAFAWRELDAEIVRQFHADGSNFEASTAYHRLSAEMALYGFAFGEALRARGRLTSPLSDAACDRLGRMATFMADVTKPNGRFAQIGDNDSGRFLKLFPAYRPATGAEDHLDPAHLLAGFAGILATPPDTAPDGHPETDLVADLAGNTRIAAPPRAEPVIARQEPPGDGMLIRDITFAPDGIDLAAGIERRAYPDFGLYLFRSERLFLAFRCGPIGINGRGAHAHNDQLSIELAIDGVDWIADPGSYLYTPAPHLRDAYRSVAAHFAPRVGEREPGSLDLGPFWLGDEAEARLLAFDELGAVAMHIGFGAPVVREIAFDAGAIRLRDYWHDPEPEIPVADPIVVKTAADAARLLAPEVPFSPGYGLQDTDPRT